MTAPPSPPATPRESEGEGAGLDVAEMVGLEAGETTTDWVPASGAAADADFTVIEMRIDRQGVGEGKTSLTSFTTGVAIDTETQTLALEGYAAAPAWLKVTR